MSRPKPLGPRDPNAQPWEEEKEQPGGFEKESDPFGSDEGSTATGVQTPLGRHDSDQQHPLARRRAPGEWAQRPGSAGSVWRREDKREMEESTAGPAFDRALVVRYSWDARTGLVRTEFEEVDGLSRAINFCQEPDGPDAACSLTLLHLKDLVVSDKTLVGLGIDPYVRSTVGRQFYRNLTREPPSVAGNAGLTSVFRGQNDRVERCIQAGFSSDYWCLDSLAAVTERQVMKLELDRAREVTAYLLNVSAMVRFRHDDIGPADEQEPGLGLGGAPADSCRLYEIEEMDGPGTTGPKPPFDGHKAKFGGAWVRPRVDRNLIVIAGSGGFMSGNHGLAVARGTVESVWIDRLGLLGRQKMGSKREFLTVMTNHVLTGLFLGLESRWDHFLYNAERHMDAINRELYHDSPNEIPTAEQVWNSKRYWAMANRLDFIDQTLERHRLLLEETRSTLAAATGTDRADWIGRSRPADFFGMTRDRLEGRVKKPMSDINELVYKLVQHQDSAVSIQLNDSMWWLSWITFIFLPLSFVASVFGMNVNWLESNPSGAYFFIIAVPVMSVCLVMLYVCTRVVYPNHRLRAVQEMENEKARLSMENIHEFTPTGQRFGRFAEFYRSQVRRRRALFYVPDRLFGYLFDGLARAEAASGMGAKVDMVTRAKVGYLRWYYRLRFGARVAEGPVLGPAGGVEEPRPSVVRRLLDQSHRRRW